MKETITKKLATPMVIAMLTVLISPWEKLAWGQTTWNVPGDGSNTYTTSDPSCNTIQGAVNGAEVEDKENAC